jgi:hypothetical protein
MNPDTNRFEPLSPPSLDDLKKELDTMRLLRPDGTPVPEHWSTFRVGEDVVIRGYTFRVAYIGETAILFEPVGPLDVLKVDP